MRAPPGDIILGATATETAVKPARLADYRIVYSAIRALIAGDVKRLGDAVSAKNAYPAF